MAILEVYNAIEIKETHLKGGTTRPFLAIAENHKHYVIKLFSRKDANQRCYTASESYAHYIAMQFDLKVREAAFINITKDYIDLIKKYSPEFFLELNKRDISRPCFSTLYLKDAPLFTPASTKGLMEDYDVETIFAFDALILNEDRKFRKPNILKSRRNYYLIDHEKAFEGINYSKSIFNAGGLCPYSKSHIFYKYLRKKAKVNGTKNMFDTFQFYLENLQINGLYELRNQLQNFGYNIDDLYYWEEYIIWSQKNVTTFVNNLRQFLK